MKHPKEAHELHFGKCKCKFSNNYHKPTCKTLVDYMKFFRDELDLKET